MCTYYVALYHCIYYCLTLAQVDAYSRQRGCGPNDDEKPQMMQRTRRATDEELAEAARQMVAAQEATDMPVEDGSLEGAFEDNSELPTGQGGGHGSGVVLSDLLLERSL